MEGRLRRSFTEEYKRQAVELVVSSGRSITSVAEELGLRDSVLRPWVEKLGQEPTAAARREDRAGRDAVSSVLTHSKARLLLRAAHAIRASLLARNRQHVVVQSFLGGFDPRFEAIGLPTLDLDQHNPRGLHEQRAHVAIVAP